LSDLANKEFEHEKISEVTEKFPIIDISELAKKLHSLSVVVSGSKGCGKSNLIKVLCSEFLKSDDICLQIFDTSLSWIEDFRELPIEFVAEHIEFDSYVNKSILYDIEFSDLDDITFIIREILLDNYNYRRDLKLQSLFNTKPIEKPKFNYYAICEEAQNIIGTYALAEKRNKLLLKIISDSRNLDIFLCFIAQRLSDVSARAIERTNAYFIGHTIGDNDLIKLRRILGKHKLAKEVLEHIPKLKVGEFFFFDGTEIYFVKVPKYQPKAKPLTECLNKKIPAYTIPINTSQRLTDTIQSIQSMKGKP